MKIMNKIAEERLTKGTEAKTMEEIRAFAEQEGVELPDDALDHVAGGAFRDGRCPRCGSTAITFYEGDNGWFCHNCRLMQSEF